MPALFARENRNKVPVAALWATNIIVQLLVITTYFSNDAFALMLNLTSSVNLIPYALVAAYGFMIAQRGETYDVRPGERRRERGLPVFQRSTDWIILAVVLAAAATGIHGLATGWIKL